MLFLEVGVYLNLKKGSAAILYQNKVFLVYKNKHEKIFNSKKEGLK